MPAEQPRPPPQQQLSQPGGSPSPTECAGCLVTDDPKEIVVIEVDRVKKEQETPAVVPPPPPPKPLSPDEILANWPGNEAAWQIILTAMQGAERRIFDWVVPRAGVDGRTKLSVLEIKTALRLLGKVRRSCLSRQRVSSR